jgi:TRAP-type C4-dicarboxylate transport system permease small subunit
MVRAFDEALFRAERVVVAAILAGMGLVVFLDVVHRVSTRQGSWLANPLVVAVAAAVLAALALRTRGRPAWLGLPFGIVVAAAQQVFVRLVPNGIIWSQALALALTLWLGLLGASLAAHDRRHLALDVGSRLVPAAWAPKLVALGHVVTAAFCAMLVWYAGASALEHFASWNADHAADTLGGTTIPKWFAAAAIPYGMAALTFRFLYEAVRTWTGALPLVGDDTLHQLGIEEPVG